MSNVLRSARDERFLASRHKPQGLKQERGVRSSGPLLAVDERDSSGMFIIDNADIASFIHRGWRVRTRHVYMPVQ